jgi:hypothetical protein
MAISASETEQEISNRWSFEVRHADKALESWSQISTSMSLHYEECKWMIGSEGPFVICGRNVL